MTLLKPLLATLLIFTLLISAGAQSTEKATPVNNVNNKQLVKKIFDELINKKNMAIFDQYFAKDVIDHSAWPGQAPGLEGLKSSVKGLFENYPDVQVNIRDMIAEGDFVVTRDEWTATEKNSGKKRSGWVIHILKIKEGIITEEWSKGWEWLNDAQ